MNSDILERLEAFEERIEELESSVDCLDYTVEILEDRIQSLSAAPKVLLKKLHVDAVVPEYKTDGAVGMDLVACCDEPVTIWPGATCVIPTGLAIELPVGFEGQVRSRSGLSVQGVAVANSPGTIDVDFRGEICVILRNHGNTFIVHKGDRIAQLVIARAIQAQVEVVEELSETGRGANGFGSTGVK